MFLLTYFYDRFVEGRLVQQVENITGVEFRLVEEIGDPEVVQHLGRGAFGEHMAEGAGIHFGEGREHLEHLTLGHGDGGARSIDRSRLDLEGAYGGEVEGVGEGMGGEGGEDPVDLVGVVWVSYWQGLVGNLEDHLQQLLGHTAVSHCHLAPVHSIHYELLHLFLHSQTLFVPVLVQTVIEPLRD